MPCAIIWPSSELLSPKGSANLEVVAGMIADENFELPDAVRDIAAIYLDLIDLLTQKIDGNRVTLMLLQKSRAKTGIGKILVLPIAHLKTMS